MADNPHPRDNPPVLGDEITTFNGTPTAPDTTGKRPINQAVGLTLSAGDGVAVWVGKDHPIPALEPGTYDYAANTVPGTVTIPETARLCRVAVAATDSAPATVTIGGGAAITIPAGGSFDEQIPGSAIGRAVVIAGAVLSYYVSWVF